MGCCTSKDPIVKQQQVNQEGPKLLSIEKVNRTKLLSPRPVWETESNSDTSSHFRLSATSFSIPMPPLGKKPSSPNLKRRSGVRLAATFSSPSLKDKDNDDQSHLQVRSMSAKTSSESAHVPRPPLVKKVSFSTIKRRSGIRLAITNPSSLEVQETSRPTPPKVADPFLSASSKGKVLSQTRESVHDAPVVSKSVSDVTESIPLKTDSISDKEPTVNAQEDGITEDAVSSPSAIDSIPGNTLSYTAAAPAELENEHQTYEGSSVGNVKCLFAEQIHVVKQTSQQPESRFIVDPTAGSSGILHFETATTRPQVMHEERQFVNDADEEKDTNEEALVSSSTNSEPNYSTCADTDAAVHELPTHGDNGIATSIELELDRVASFLATQAIQKALLEETADMYGSYKQASEALPNKDGDLAIVNPDYPVEKAGILFAQAESLKKALPENASHCVTVKSNNKQQSITKVAMILSSQAINTAALDVETEQTEMTHGMGVDKVANDGCLKQNDIISATERAGVKSNDVTILRFENSEVTESQDYCEELIVKGKAIIIPKVPTPLKTKRDFKGVPSVSKGSSRQSAVPTLVKTPSKKQTVGQSRSLGTMAKTRTNTENINRDKSTQMNRSSSLNTAPKTTTSKNSNVVVKKSSQTSTLNEAKKLMPIKKETKPRGPANVSTVVKTEQTKKLSQTIGVTKAPSVPLKQSSKSLGNGSQSLKEKVLVTTKTVSSQNVLKSKSQPSKHSVESQVSIDSRNVNLHSDSKVAAISPAISTRTVAKKIDVKALEPVRNRKTEKGTSLASNNGETKSSSPNHGGSKAKTKDVFSIRTSSCPTLPSTCINSKCLSPVRSSSDKTFEGKIRKRSPLSSPKRVHNPNSPTQAWLRGTAVTDDGSVVSRKLSPGSITRMSAQRSQSPSNGSSFDKISVDRIPSSSPIRLRSGSKKHLQDL